MSVKVETNLGKLPAWMSRPTGVGTPATPLEKPSPKTIGETPPVVANLADFPDLAPLFAHYGAIQKQRRKLKLLSGKDAKVVLAKNTVGAADNKGMVYLGVDFLREHAKNDPLLAAVMAHEWGHLISNMAKHGNLDHLSWDEIFQLRRDEEAAADAFCGRMLAMMGYSTDAIIRFLKAAEKSSPTVKYYAAPIRGAIIQEAFTRHAARTDLTRKIFKERAYPNPYTSRIILADE